MKTKFFFSVLVLFVLGTLPSFGADESVTFSEQGYTNQQAVSSYSGTDFSIAFDKGSNSNAPKYYTSGTAIRAYGGNTMTFSSSTKTLVQITLTFGSSDGTNAITTDVGTYNNGTWTGSASSITFTIGGTSGNRRIAGAEVTYESDSGGCEKNATISAGTTTNGTFDLSKTGAQATCDGAVEVVVTPNPAPHYEVNQVTASNGGSVSGPDSEGKFTVTYAKDYNNSSEINVTFKAKAQYTVTWNVNGETSTSQVYKDEKPVFPATPASCDATSTTFIGWATAPWDGKIPNLDGKTVYTSASAMPNVTGNGTIYYAVFAKVAGESGWSETAIADLGASDIFVIVGGTYAMTNDNGTGSAPAAVAVTISDDKISGTPANKLKWNISGNATDGYTFYPNGSTTTWLYCNTTAASSSNNNMRVGTGTRKVFEIDANGYLVTKDSNTARYLSIYNNADFRGYTSTGAAILPKFYKYSAGSASDYLTTCCTKYNITIADNIEHGSISADVASACEGTTVTITFSPAGGYHLDSWSVNDTHKSEYANTFTMPGEDVTVSALFAHDQCTNLFAPTLNEITKDYNSATIKWNSVANAVSYDVTIVRHSDSEVIFSGNMEATQKALTDLEPETQYDYSIMGVGDGSAYCTSGNYTLDGNFTTSALPTAHLTLMNLGTEHAASGDYAILTPFNLPSTAAACSKTFVGWDADADCNHAPTYAAGAEFTFENTNAVTLYAVYADGGATEETATVSIASYATANSWVSGTQYTSVTLDENVTATASWTGTGNKNTGKYYTNGNDWRYYQNESATITIATTVGELSSVKFAYGISNTGILEDTDNNVVESATAVSASGTSAVYHVANSGTATNGQVKFTAIEVKYLKPGSYSNYSTTCAAAAEVVIDPEEINATAAGRNGVIEALYENVNEEAVSVALYNDAACTETYTGEWLTVSLDNDKNIAYTIVESNVYVARTAYIKLTAPETTGATAPAEVIIPVEQEAKALVFSSLEDLVAANLASGTEVTVSFSNILITEVYKTKAGYRYGLYLNVKDEGGENDIELFYNKQADVVQVPESWVKNGYVSATNLVGTWTLFSGTWELAMQGATWSWENGDITYAAPKAVSSVVVSGEPTKKAYVDGEKFNPAGLTVTVNYTVGDPEVIDAADADWVYESSDVMALNQTSINVKATYNTVTSENFYEVTGLTVNPIPNKTIAQFIADQGGRCYLEGVVSNYTNKTKGYFDITDASGTLHIYGCTDPSEFDENDNIKIIAEEYEYYHGETHEAKNVEFVSKAAVPVTGVTLPSTASVKKGKTITLTPMIVPSNASNKKVTWSITSGSDYASVNEEGVVSGLAAGEAVIQVETEDGGYTALCTVTVTEAPDFAHGDWMLVTVANELTAGSYVIIAAAEYDKAMKPYVSGNNCKSKDATKSGSMITYDSEFGIFAVQAGTKENTIALFDEDNNYYLYAASGSSNYLKGETELDDNGSWTVSVADGVATLTAQGTNTRNIIKYNAADDQQLFSCYASTSTNMKAIALYKYYAPVPKVLYDKNTEEDVTDLPGTTRAELEDNVYKATISTTTPHRSGYQFTGWKDADNNDYIAGNKYTITDDITLYAQWNMLAGHHITYVTVGTAPTDENTYYAGDAVTLASADGLSNPGYVFDGWNDGANTYPANYDEYQMPDNDVTFTAVWSRMSTQKWVLVENLSDIKTDGTEYVIAAAGYNVAMAALNGDIYTTTPVVKNGNILTGSESMIPLTFVAGSGDGVLAMKHGDLYLASTAEKKMTERGTAFYWTVSIADGVTTFETLIGTNPCHLQYNSGSPRFTTYKSTQKPLALYEKAPMVEINDGETVQASAAQGADIVIYDGGTLAVDDQASIGDLTVEEGGKVTLSNKKLTVTGTFAIETTMGSGKSGELSGVNGSNFAVTGEAYIDITLGDNGNADKWHAFTVPFPVDALNGIFDLDGNKLTNEQNYAIMDYHGDIRAQGKYGWKKFRGTLVPGTFYLMTVDGLRTTYRMKMKAGSNVVAANSKAVTAYDGEGDDTDKGWNGIGNPTLAYGQVNVAVQVLDPVNYVYVTKNANSCNFIVGTPFFYQASANGTIAMEDASGTAYYAPICKAVKTTEQIKVSLANENYTDNLFISASEDATTDYQVGKDLVKMTMTNTPIVPQIFGVAYKTQLSMVHAPLVGDRANYTLNLYAPADGEYTISAQQTEDAIVYLTYEGSPIWNITAGEYNCDLQKGNNSGFGLLLVRRAPQVTTDIEGANQSQNGVRKLLINGQLFIEKEGKLFNVTGQRL